MIAVDFAWDVPPVATLKACNVSAVGRYVGPSPWGKTITQAEFDEYTAAGIAVWLVFEMGSNDSAGGFAAGVANAQLALANVPTGYLGAIYMAADEDLRGDALATAVEYIHGASTVLGVARTGDYGPGALCQATHDAGFAKYHWQSGSTSFNGNSHTLPITQIQQGVGQPIPGHDTDPNTIFAEDFGQHPPVGPPSPTPSPAVPQEDPMDTIDWCGYSWRAMVSPAGHLVCDVQAVPGSGRLVNLDRTDGAPQPSYGCKFKERSFVFGDKKVNQLVLNAVGAYGFIEYTFTQGESQWVSAA